MPPLVRLSAAGYDQPYDGTGRVEVDGLDGIPDNKAITACAMWLEWGPLLASQPDQDDAPQEDPPGEPHQCEKCGASADRCWAGALTVVPASGR